MNDLPAKQARSFYALKSQWSNWFSVIFANTDSLLHSKHFRCETPPVTKKLDKGTEWKQIARREKKKKKKFDMNDETLALPMQRSVNKH